MHYYRAKRGYDVDDMDPEPMVESHPGFDRTDPTYNAWSNMKARCDNPNHPNYKHYGAKGVSYSKRWSKFSNFLEDMGRSPRKGYSIDRINPFGDYCKNNCRWASSKQQGLNKRLTKRKDTGVCYMPNRRDTKWRASVGAADNPYYLAYFKTREEAELARKEELGKILRRLER